MRGGGGLWADGRAGAFAAGSRRGERYHDWMAAQLGENTDQLNYRRQFEGALTFGDMQQGKAPPSASSADDEAASFAAIKAEMESVATAAREAAAALKNVKPAPSVIPT